MTTAPRAPRSAWQRSWRRGTDGGGAVLDAVLATPKLSAVMAVLFVSLSIPILVFILISDDHRRSAAIFATLRG